MSERRRKYYREVIVPKWYSLSEEERRLRRAHINNLRKARYASSETARLRNKELMRRHDLKRHYGITLEQYEEIKLQQKGVCALCGGLSPTGKNLSVDHDHRDGHIRGLLCDCCNRSWGHLEKRGVTLINLYAYLTRSRKSLRAA